MVRFSSSLEPECCRGAASDEGWVLCTPHTITACQLLALGHARTISFVQKNESNQDALHDVHQLPEGDGPNCLEEQRQQRDGASTGEDVLRTLFDITLERVGSHFRHQDHLCNTSSGWARGARHALRDNSYILEAEGVHRHTKTLCNAFMSQLLPVTNLRAKENR